MRKKFGAFCMILGALLLFSAVFLLIYNHVEASKAGQSSAQVVSQLKDVIPDSENQPTDPVAEPDISKANPMETVEIDGYDYIGYLRVPLLGLELPVVSGWDYQALQVAPCRFSGSVAQKNLVVIAHNYSSHFGNLDQLQFEDEVLFTDVTGAVTAYRVDCVDVVPPSSAEEVVSGDFDLALVTCTYGGKTRFVVYCDEDITH